MHAGQEEFTVVFTGTDVTGVTSLSGTEFCFTQCEHGSFGQNAVLVYLVDVQYKNFSTLLTAGEPRAFRGGQGKIAVVVQSHSEQIFPL